MNRPLILSVDPDPADLRDLDRELRGRYGADYEVVCIESPREALRLLEELHRMPDADVALVLAPQWLPDTTGVELLDRVWELHPRSKRGLLIPWRGWADPPTAAAIVEGMALGAVNYYVLKPSTPPDEVFHHAISGFLLEWTQARRISPHTIRVVGEAWEGRAYELRNALQRCAIPHEFCLADSDRGRRLLAGVDHVEKLPAILLPDGQVLCDPTNLEMAAATGASIDFDADEFDIVIVGAGPAGLSAAVYGASEGLRTLVVDEGGLGGQATSSALIRNYLGFPRGVSGTRLAEQAYEQAWVFGAQFGFMHRATGLHRDGDQVVLELEESRQVRSRTLILATGATYRRLDLPALEELTGAGVFYGGPVSEGPGLAGKVACVVGGANSAGQAALNLADYAERVMLLVRADCLDAGMSHYLIREIEATPNIDVRCCASVVGGGGEGRLDHLVLRDSVSGDQDTVHADALFVLIGVHPHTDWLPGEVARAPDGFLLTGEAVAATGAWPLERPPLGLETSMPGVFAAGDVRKGAVKRVAAAVGEGSAAIQQVHTLLADRSVARLTR